MSTVQNFEQFLKFLGDNKVPNRVDAERQIIELPSKGAPLPGNLLIKWEKQVPFIQIIHMMIENVPADRIRDLETAIIRLDNRLEVGGFGFDHQSNRVYNRLTVPVIPPAGIDPLAISQLGHGVIRSGKEFLEVFQEIVGGKSGEQVFELLDAVVAKRKAAATSSGGAQA
jgi:hypothetical protein